MQKRASKSTGGIYPVSFKIKAIKRVERGEGVLPVARDIGVTRKALHDWIRAWNAMGVEGLNRKRGRKPGRLKLRAVAMTGTGSGALAVARAHCGAGADDRAPADGTRFFSTSLAHAREEGSARQNAQAIFETIKAMSAAHPEADVQRLCRLAGISRASFYRHREESDPDAADHDLQDAIQHICLRHKYYGYRRVTATLRRQGHVVNAKRILRLMRADNLLAQRRKPFIVPPKGKPEAIIIVPNLVRGLVPSGPDQIWVADITYVHLAKAFAYLAVILDAFSRKAVGWALAEGLGTSLAITALDQALEARRPPKGSLIHHSDRGIQYASNDYRQRLADHDIAVSMSRPGNPYDNAKAESFMKTLKYEELNARSFKTISDARARIDDFIANIYNSERLHSALGYRSPLEFETAFTQNKD